MQTMSNWSDTFWTPPIVERFKVLLQERPWPGYQAMAETLTREFNVPFTKNALIGKAKRDHFAPRLRSVPGGKRGDYTILPPLKRPLPRQKGDPSPVEHHPEVEIWDLGPHTCRWPYGEYPPYLYCGQRPLVDSPYCAEHSRIAFPSLRNAI